MNICNLAQRETISISVESNLLKKPMTFIVRKGNTINKIKEEILKQIPTNSFVNKCSQGHPNSTLYLFVDGNQVLGECKVQDKAKFYIHFDNN